MNGQIVRTLIERSRPEKLRDRCLVVSLAVQEVFGGDVMMYKHPAEPEHFANSIFGQRYDFMDDHDSWVDAEVLESPEFLHRVPRVETQLAHFRARLREQLLARLSIQEIQHVVIQGGKENQGSYLRPHFSHMLLLGSREHRLDSGLFAPGQTFWLKFLNGPIVATGKLARWVVASRRDWTDDDIRSICCGSSLADHEQTWRRVSESTASHFLFLEIDAAEPLDVPVYPNAQAYGRTIVPLTTAARQIAWLDSDWCDFQLPVGSFAKPTIYQPFYRFRWETELDAEVSQAIDERMPRGGRFWDRVRIVNESLREYFKLVEGEADVRNAFREDELTALAEIVEAADEGVSQRLLVRYTRQAGEEIAINGGDGGIDLLEIAEHVGSLNPTEFVALMDAVNTIVSRLDRLDAPRPRRSLAVRLPPARAIEDPNDDVD